ncbi:hypothetical protein Aple_010890 [Acrocarpospora pleiomorpha]|uniref:Exonuclease domain-containing protein n=1 Tax=Acrocarpospora pleiomorpha TaxID=90975 RepID=A0A5M3XAM6_9ACTN|nr:3'-5' exonuclease [Acrocarpospora pleiomorpha]GES18194.1 hypothetical protein Aple_010890 [Acrocarpospora pleiomorpha]
MSDHSTTTAAAAAPRKRAHDHRQLAEVLSWTPGQVNRALAAGVLPAYDMKTPRWSGPLVDQLEARREELTTAIPDDVDGDELMTLLGITYGDYQRGRNAGVIPGPDRPSAWGLLWTRGLAEELAGRAEEIRAAIPPAPLGAHRCAALLSERTGLDVAVADITTLNRRDLTSVVDWYKKWALYDVAALLALIADEAGLATLTEIVTERQAWMAASITAKDAAHWLGWRVEDLQRVAGERGMKPGRFDRWARTDVAALTEDEELIERVRREQLLGPEQAAVHMEIRRRDFDYVVAAGWVRPVQWVTREVGVRKTVEVPLYQVGDLEDALAEVPGVDWEAVRAVKPGGVSPLREHTRLPAARAQVIRAFCAQLAADHKVEVWPHFWNAGDRWEIDWEINEDGHPTKPEVAAALSAHRGARQHIDHITLSTAVGQVIRWARECLKPGAAVVIDTETTGLAGVVVEIAVVDACTGDVLLDTLVNPGGVPVEDGARMVHGISDEALGQAPTWDQVFPLFLAAVGSARLLAYNAPFDRAAIAATHANAGLWSGGLPAGDRWDCIMDARSTWARVGYWLALGGGHRARGDALDARRVLQAIGTPHGGR